MHDLENTDKDCQYYFTLIKKGTAQDKANAYTALIKQSPFHCLSLLQSMLGLARKRNRKQAEFSLHGLKDVFMNYILKDDSKLVTFQKNEGVMSKRED